MTTRQEAIEALEAFLRTHYVAEGAWRQCLAAAFAYLQAPIPDAELWENRESIGKLLGPWEIIDESWMPSEISWARKSIAGFLMFQTSEDRRHLADQEATNQGYRFVDGPVAVVPKSKGKLGPWIEGIEGGWWLREGGGGSVAFVCLSINGRFRRSQGPSFYTFIEAQAAEDKWLMEQGWELEGGPVVVEPREEPKKEAGEKALAEEVNEVKTVLCWLSDRVSDTTRPIPTSVMDDLRAKVEELESRHNEVDRVNSAQAEAIDDLRTKVVKLEEAKTILTREVRRLQELDVTGYETLKSQFLADCAFRKEILLKLCGAWRLSVDKDYIFRDNTPASIAILQLGYQAQFGSNSYWFADLSSAKAWCDEQLRAAGYLLQDGEKL